MQAISARDLFRQLHKIVHQNKTFSAGDGSKRYVASNEPRIGPSKCRSSHVCPAGRPGFTDVAACPVFRTDERFLLLSSILLLDYGEPDGGYLTPRTASGGLSRI
jgi:hypothetical protein